MMRGKIVDTTMEALQGGMSWRALADEPWLFKESQPRAVLCAPATGAGPRSTCSDQQSGLRSSARPSDAASNWRSDMVHLAKGGAFALQDAKDLGPVLRERRKSQMLHIKAAVMATTN